MTDTPATTPKTSTAFHEAGHAVAIYLQGGELTYISALPDGTRWGGICTWKMGEHSCCDCSPIRDAVVALAGPMAEGRAVPLDASLSRRATGIKPYTGDPQDLEDAINRAQERHDKRGGTPTDGERATQLVNAHAGSELEAAALLRWVKYRTLALVQTAKFGYLTRHLASVLVDVGHIDGAAATAELQRAELQFERAHRLAAAESETGWEPA